LKNPRACPKKGHRREAERSKPRKEKSEATRPTTWPDSPETVTKLKEGEPEKSPNSQSSDSQVIEI